MNISSAQLKRLQVLWGQHARHEMLRDSRDERLRWASDQIKRQVNSFKDLTLSEASELINLLQAQLGIAETSPAKRTRKYRSRMVDREQAHAAGTEGRRGSAGKITLATAEDIGMIESQLNAMNWTRERLDALLRSSSSPLGRRANPQLRTVSDVNRVLWALKGIAKAQARHQEVAQ